MELKPVYVVYGSQTGNAECISKDVEAKLIELEIPCVCMPLNSAKKVVLKDEARFAVVICSTTGNGDAPENADAWWRSIKLRSAAKDSFQGLPYCVLGLGDTNYDKFCHMGKSIDKRLAELGADRRMELCCVDEATGLEETVEKWKKSFFLLMQSLDLPVPPGQTSGSGGGSATNEEKANESKVNDADEQGGKNEENRVLPEGIMSFNEVASWLGLSEAVSSPPDESLLPKQRSTGGGARGSSEVPASTLLSHSEARGSLEHKSSSAGSHVSDNRVSSSGDLASGGGFLLSSQEKKTCPDERWTVETPYSGKIMSARYLTSNNHNNHNNSNGQARGSGSETPSEWESARRVIHAEIALGDSGIKYLPGDSIGICCPNRIPLVELVLERLKMAEPAANLHMNSLLLSKENAPELTLGKLLTWDLDLHSIPKKADVLTLSQFCTDPKEASAMRWLCAKSDVAKQLWSQFIEAQGVGLGELLALFPSCTPRLSTLYKYPALEPLTKMPPRYYSIASSPLLNFDRVCFAFSVVQYCCGVSVPPSSSYTPSSSSSSSSSSSPPSSSSPSSNIAPRIKRSGLCTWYLEQILSPWLNPQQPQSQSQSQSHTQTDRSAALTLASDTVFMFHKQSIYFRLPGSVAPPLILIGPGTGVAPFIGFLEHRSQVEKERSCSGDEISTGVWRGCFELEEKDLPGEGTRVEQYIQSVTSGPIHLFFGCRNDDDYLYRDTLARRLKEKVLTSLDVAMSRVGPEKVYVTHLLRARASEIARLVLHEGAYIYVCGDGNKMAKDVNATVKEILVNQGGLAEDQVEDVINDLKCRRRYVQDIWS